MTKYPYPKGEKAMSNEVSRQERENSDETNEVETEKTYGGTDQEEEDPDETEEVEEEKNN